MHLTNFEEPQDQIAFWHTHTFLIPQPGIQNVLLKGPRFRTQYANVSFCWRIGVSEGSLGDETFSNSNSSSSPPNFDSSAVEDAAETSEDDRPSISSVMWNRNAKTQGPMSSQGAMSSGNTQGHTRTSTPTQLLVQKSDTQVIHERYHKIPAQKVRQTAAQVPTQNYGPPPPPPPVPPKKPSPPKRHSRNPSLQSQSPTEPTIPEEEELTPANSRNNSLGNTNRKSHISNDSNVMTSTVRSSGGYDKSRNSGGFTGYTSNGAHKSGGYKIQRNSAGFHGGGDVKIVGTQNSKGSNVVKSSGDYSSVNRTHTKVMQGQTSEPGNITRNSGGFNSGNENHEVKSQTSQHSGGSNYVRSSGDFHNANQAHGFENQKTSGNKSRNSGGFHSGNESHDVQHRNTQKSGGSNVVSNSGGDIQHGNHAHGGNSGGFHSVTRTHVMEHQNLEAQQITSNSGGFISGSVIHEVKRQNSQHSGSSNVVRNSGDFHNVNQPHGFGYQKSEQTKITRNSGGFHSGSEIQEVKSQSSLQSGGCMNNRNSGGTICQPNSGCKYCGNPVAFQNNANIASSGMLQNAARDSGGFEQSGGFATSGGFGNSGGSDAGGFENAETENGFYTGANSPGSGSSGGVEYTEEVQQSGHNNAQGFASSGGFGNSGGGNTGFGNSGGFGQFGGGDTGFGNSGDTGGFQSSGGFGNSVEEDTGFNNENEFENADETVTGGFENSNSGGWNQTNEEENGGFGNTENSGGGDANGFGDSGGFQSSGGFNSNNGGETGGFGNSGGFGNNSGGFGNSTGFGNSGDLRNAAGFDDPNVVDEENEENYDDYDENAAENEDGFENSGGFGDSNGAANNTGFGNSTGFGNVSTGFGNTNGFGNAPTNATGFGNGSTGFGNAPTGFGNSNTGFGNSNGFGNSGGFDSNDGIAGPPPVLKAIKKRKNMSADTGANSLQASEFHRPSSRTESHQDRNRDRRAVILSIECTDGIMSMGHNAFISVFIRHPNTRQMCHMRWNMPLSIDPPKGAICQCNQHSCVCVFSNRRCIALDTDYEELQAEGLVNNGEVEVVVILHLPVDIFDPMFAFNPLPPPDTNKLVLHMWQDVIMSKETTDTNLCAIDGDELRCHRTLLAYKSPIFQQLFEQRPPIKFVPPRILREESHSGQSHISSRGNSVLVIKRRAPNLPNKQNVTRKNESSAGEDTDSRKAPKMGKAKLTLKKKKRPNFNFCWGIKSKKYSVTPQTIEDPRLISWRKEQSIAGPGGKVKLEYSAEVILEMLKFVYSQKHSEKFIESDEPLVTSVLRLASHYKMRDLIGRCERQLVVVATEQIDANPRLLRLAHVFHLKILGNVSASTILRYYGIRGKAKDNETWAHLESDNLRQLLLTHSTETARTNFMLEDLHCTPKE